MSEQMETINNIDNTVVEEMLFKSITKELTKPEFICSKVLLHYGLSETQISCILPLLNNETSPVTKLVKV